MIRSSLYNTYESIKLIPRLEGTGNYEGYIGSNTFVSYTPIMGTFFNVVSVKQDNVDVSSYEGLEIFKVNRSVLASSTGIVGLGSVMGGNLTADRALFTTLDITAVIDQNSFILGGLQPFVAHLSNSAITTNTIAQGADEVVASNCLTSSPSEIINEGKFISINNELVIPNIPLLSGGVEDSNGNGLECFNIIYDDSTKDFILRLYAAPANIKTPFIVKGTFKLY